MSAFNLGGHGRHQPKYNAALRFHLGPERPGEAAAHRDNPRGCAFQAEGSDRSPVEAPRVAFDIE